MTANKPFALALVAESGFLSLKTSLGLLAILKVNGKSVGNKEKVIITCAPERGPRKLRFWRSLLLRRAEAPQVTDFTSEYNKYLLLFEDVAAKSKSTGQFGEIQRDVVRTFQKHPFFQAGAKGLKMMARILQALLLAEPTIGYCQGMNFVAANLILARLPVSVTGLDINDLDHPSDTPVYPQEDIDDSETFLTEAEVFDLMRILISKDFPMMMGGLWSPDVPRMKLRVYQMDRLIQWTYPKLHAHFVDIQLAPEMFVAQWFLTIFSYTIPSHTTLKIWDLVFYGGWPAMFRVGLSILYILEPSFLSKDIEGVGVMMRDWKKLGKNEALANKGSVHKVLSRAQLVVVSDEILQQLQESFALEMITLSESSLSSTTKSSNTKALTLPFLRSPDDSTSKRSLMQAQGAHVGESLWLSRYGSEVSSEVAAEMVRIRDDLLMMEKQVDVDKQLIQQKLVKACENYRDVEERWNESSTLCLEQEALVAKLERELREAISRAQHVAQSIANYYERSTVSAIKRSTTNLHANARTLGAVSEVLEANKSFQMQGLAAVNSFEASEDENSPRSFASQGLDSVSDDSTFERTSLSSALDGSETMSQRRRFRGKFQTGSNVPWIGFKAQQSLSSASISSVESSPGKPESQKGEKPVRSSSSRSSKSMHSADHYSSACSSPANSAYGDSPRIGSEMVPELRNSKLSAGDDSSSDEEEEVDLYLRSTSQTSEVPESHAQVSASTKSRFTFANISSALLHLSSPPKQTIVTQTSAQEAPDLTHLAIRAQRSLSESTDSTSVDDNSRVALSMSAAASTFLTGALEQLTQNFTAAANKVAGVPAPGKTAVPAEDIFNALATDSQRCQQEIVSTHRALQEAKELLTVRRQSLSALKVELDEASEWKGRLCDQFQLLVEDANRGRKQKLQFLTESYLV